MRRAGVITGFLTMALTSAAAALATEPALPVAAAVATAQPLGAFVSGPSGVLGDAVPPDTGLLLLVGGGLVGLGAIVRRATRTVQRDGT